MTRQIRFAARLLQRRLWHSGRNIDHPEHTLVIQAMAFEKRVRARAHGVVDTEDSALTVSV